MKYILQTLLCTLIALSANAQIIEVPPPGNPLLQKQHSALALRNPTGCDKQEELSVQAGTAYAFCIDTAQGFFSLQNTNCEPLQFGTVSINNNCVTYTANSVAYANDVLCLEYCPNDSTCCIYTYNITVRSTRTLPFVDDFSYKGFYPDTTLWVDNLAFLNSTYGINPPSVGMATLDGLDATGSPYGGGYGISDYLTSTFINLSGYTATSNVNLSFYAQPKGWGDKPEYKDSLVVEFKNDAGFWKLAGTIPGLLDSVSNYNTFDLYVFPIATQEFLHSGFQFRIKNYSSRNGLVDIWNIDYVRLTADIVPTNNFEDIAFTQLPKPFLRRYSSMPFSHLSGNAATELDTALFINLYNHFPEVNDVQQPRIMLSETTTNTNNLLDYVLLDGTQFNIPTAESVSYTNPIPTSFQADLANRINSDFPSNAPELRFLTTYSFIALEELNLQAFRRNDTVQYESVLKNYFAYDDGTAESHIALQNSTAAIQFHANIPDTLRAIEMLIPHVNQVDVSNKTFNIKVWIGTLDETPEYEAQLQRPYYTDNYFDTLQGFTTYLLIDDITNELKPLGIPAGDFYVGWQQLTCNTDCIPIGLDKNYPEAIQYMKWKNNNSSTWQSFPATYSGALMIRPVVGAITPWSTSIDEVLTVEDFLLSPNPTTDILYIQLKNNNLEQYNVSIFNNVGQRILHQSLQPNLDVSNFAAGMYFLALTDKKTGKSVTQKWVKQ